MPGELDQEPAAPESTTKQSTSPSFSVPSFTKQAILNTVGRLEIPNELTHQNHLNNWKALFNWVGFCPFLRMRPTNPVGPRDTREPESKLDTSSRPPLPLMCRGSQPAAFCSGEVSERWCAPEGRSNRGSEYHCPVPPWHLWTPPKDCVLSFKALGP